jgi:hypothetical protein
MNKAKLLLGLVALCVATIVWARIEVHFDRNVEFSQYKTYAWQQGTPAKDPLMQRRIERAVSAKLQAAGLTEVTSAAELSVITHAASEQRKEVQTGNFGYGPMSPGFGEQEFTMTINTGTLRVDLVDTRSHKLVWSATASKTLSDNPKKVAKLIEKVVTKMFKHFPPRQ